ncbi:hypothetical protein ACQCT5_03120 [Sutcliffiella halmapala]
MENELLKQILQGINELKTDVSVLKADGIEIKSDISGLKEGQTSLQQGQTRLEQDFAAFKHEYRKDIQRIELRLNGTNERLDSFKFDTDLIIEKEAKLEFRVNNLEKHLK